MTLARQAVTALPTHAFAWNTLGLALCRAGEWEAALDAVEKSMTLSRTFTAWNWLPLATALWHLENKDRAVEAYEKAVASMEHCSPDDAVLLEHLREETAELLGIGK